jgi:hypothetical protein
LFHLFYLECDFAYFFFFPCEVIIFFFLIFLPPFFISFLLSFPLSVYYFISFISSSFSPSSSLCFDFSRFIGLLLLFHVCFLFSSRIPFLPFSFRCYPLSSGRHVFSSVPYARLQFTGSVRNLRNHCLAVYIGIMHCLPARVFPKGSSLCLQLAFVFGNVTLPTERVTVLIRAVDHTNSALTFCSNIYRLD